LSFTITITIIIVTIFGNKHNIIQSVNKQFNLKAAREAESSLSV